MRACPECEELFDEVDEFCPHHGVRLVAQATPGRPATAAFVSRGPAPPALAVAAAPGGYDRLIGTTIDGRYQIEKKLGEGGMGIVFRAHHALIEKTVAVKFLKREVARDQSILQRFLQEAKAASRIGHPNIVDVTDFGTLPDASVYFVMEYMDGTTLARAMREGELCGAAKALPVVAQIARALGAAHQKGIVHRDLKPENIFLLHRDGRSDFVKIMDFGIAKVSPLEGNDDHGPRLTRAGTVFGTPEYMAPEQAQGRSDIDHRVDVYALGTILYEMLVGSVPHRGETLVATLAMQMLDPVVPPRQAAPDGDISHDLEAVVLKALAKERDERFASMGEFLSALELAAGGIVLDAASLAGTGAARTLPDTPASLSGPDAPTLRPVFPKSGGQPAGVTVPYAPPSGLPARVAKAITPSARSRAPWIGAAGLSLSAALLAALVTDSGKDRRPMQKSALDAGEHQDLSLDAAPRHAPEPTAGPAFTAPSATPVQRDSVLGLPAPPADEVSVDVIVRTNPKGGELQVDGDPAGHDGTTFRRLKGTHLAVRCRLVGHDMGKIAVSFDGSVSAVICTMAKRKPKCVPGLKDPFNECPE